MKAMLHRLHSQILSGGTVTLSSVGEDSVVTFHVGWPGGGGLDLPDVAFVALFFVGLFSYRCDYHVGSEPHNGAVARVEAGRDVAGGEF